MRITHFGAGPHLRHLFFNNDFFDNLFHDFAVNIFDFCGLLDIFRFNRAGRRDGDDAISPIIPTFRIAVRRGRSPAIGRSVARTRAVG